MFSKALVRSGSLVQRAVYNKLPRRPMSSHDVALKESRALEVFPSEPFEQGYARRQKGNNFVLVAGLSFFAFSFTFVLNSGVMVPNLTPPKKNLGEF